MSKETYRRIIKNYDTLPLNKNKCKSLQNYFIFELYVTQLNIWRVAFYCAALTWVDLHLKKIWAKELYMFANHFRLFDWSIPKFNPLSRKWVQIKHFEEGSDKKPNVTHVSILIDTLPGCKTNKTCRWLILSYCREIECVKFNPLILRLERGLKLKIPKKLANLIVSHLDTL